MAAWTVSAVTRVLTETAISFSTRKVIQDVFPRDNVARVEANNVVGELQTLHTVNVTPSLNISITTDNRRKDFKLGLTANIVCQKSRKYRILCKAAIKMYPGSHATTHRVVWVKNHEVIRLNAIVALDTDILKIVAGSNCNEAIVLVEFGMQERKNIGGNECDGKTKTTCSKS